MLRRPACCIALALLIIVAPSCGGGGEDEPELEGVEIVRVDGNAHTEEDVDYGRTPPAGGPHYRAWINCGFYDDEVPEEMAVHSLEHGAVWIAYDPELVEGEVDALHDLARADAKVLVTPVEGMDAPVVVSAWARQLELDGADDPRLEAFIERYRDASSAPEDGGPCSGALGEPIP
jgi:hypothetical protein